MFEIYKYLELAIFVFFCLGALGATGMLIHFIRGYKKENPIPHSDEKAKFAIFIPARDESIVVEANIKSIKKSLYPQELLDIYVIVESKDDPTVEIVKNYDNVRIFYRKDLTKVGKGYALNECLHEIYKENDIYDAFIILDADNIIAPDFIARLNDAYQAGFDIACGKRENKDWNASTVCGASALTFSIINTIQNKPKANLGMNVTLSGTGFFFRADVLRAYGGWPFHTLTEDYELTNYATVKELKTTYLEDAIFYDEQPLTIWKCIVQHTRWIKGYFSVRRKYKKEKLEVLKKNKKKANSWAQYIGAIPMFVIAFSLIFYIIILIVYMIAALCMDRSLFWMYFYRTLGLIAALYLFAVALTILLFYLDRKTIQIKKWNRIKVILYHPIFMFTYVISAVRAIYTKSSWDKIEHVLNIEDE